MKFSFVAILLVISSVTASAQTRWNGLIVRNTSGDATTLTQTSSGLMLNNTLRLQNPNDPTSIVTLVVPISGSNQNFTFPAVGGTLLTASGGVVAASQGGTGMTSYSQGALLIGNASGGLSALAAGTSTYVLTSNGPGTAPSWQLAPSGVSLAANNTWTGVQSFPISLSQGNALISSINAASSPIGVASGGTGLTSVPAGGLLIGNGTSLTTLAAGTSAYVLTSNGAGVAPSWQAVPIGISLAANNTWTGVQTFSVSSAQGNTLVSSINASSTAIGVAAGGTGLTSVPTGALLIGNGSTLTALAAGTSTYVLTSNGAATAPTWQPSASGVSLTANNTWTGTQTFAISANQGAALVNSVNASTSIINVANGGTGQSSYTNGQLMIGNSTGSTLTRSTLTAGTGIAVTNGAGSITISTPVASILSGQTTSNMDNNANINYYIPIGSTAGGTTTLSFKLSQLRVAHTGAIRNLYVDITAAPGSGKSHIFTVRNVTAGTELTAVSISDAATSGNSGSASLSVSAGDIITLKHTSTGGPANAEAVWTFEMQ